jgi:hypothetical protein
VLASQRSSTGSADSSARQQNVVILRGRVIRREGGTPITGVDIWAVSVNQHVSTDTAGGFRFVGLPVGQSLIQVRRLGFGVLRDTIQLSAEHENVRTYALEPSAADLDTMRTISPERRYISPQLRAFEQRRVSGQGGHFISDSVLRHNENSTLSNLIVSRMPGITALAGKVLVSTRKACRGLVILGGGCAATTGQNCYVSIYLDGNLYYSPAQGVTPPDLTRVFPVSDIAGAEYYADGATAPMGMHSNDEGCGSLWLWTRER